MTKVREKDYLNISNKAHLMNAKNCLNNIIPESSDIIEEKKFRTATKIISELIEAHFKEIHVE